MRLSDNDNKHELRFLSVCSGIEAASVAWGPLGWKAIGFAEIDKAASAVLAHHYPDVPNYGDFSKIDTTKLGRVDILCGGTPCQAFSVAGARRSLEDERGNLSLEFVRLAHELTGQGHPDGRAAAGNGLRNVIWENVVGVLSTKDNAFGCFLAGLVGADDALPPPRPRKWPNAGMVSGPKGRAAWRILNAQYFGLAQRRKRVLVVADFGNGADPAAVLFERGGVPRNPPARGEAGEGTALPTGVSAAISSGQGWWSESAIGAPVRAQEVPKDSTLIAFAPEIARCVATREGSSQDFESTTMVAVGVTGDISHALKAEGADASEDGTGRGTPIIAFNARQDPTFGPIADSLGTKDTGHGIMVPAQTVALRGRDGGATAEMGGDVATALRASSGGGDKPHVLYAPETYPTLSASEGGTLTQVPPVVTSAVRRLTPRECERLQGFQWLCSPDYPGAWQDEAGRWWSPDYTRIPVRKYDKPKYTKNRPPDMWSQIDGEWWLMSADGPRYKQLGNSWAVPKFRWLGERIARFMPATTTADNDNKQDSNAAAA